MSHDNAKQRAVVPGKAILGVAGAAKANAASIGGAVVPGKAILGKEIAAKEAAALRDAQLKRDEKDEKAQTGPKEPKANKPEAAAKTPKDPKPAEKTKAPKPKAGMSEADVVAMVDADPNTWEKVLDLELARAEGLRTVVAAALLNAAPVASKPAMPAAVVDMLRAAVQPDEDDESGDAGAGDGAKVDDPRERAAEGAAEGGTDAGAPPAEPPTPAETKPATSRRSRRRSTSRRPGSR